MSGTGFIMFGAVFLLFGSMLWAALQMWRDQASTLKGPMGLMLWGFPVIILIAALFFK
ncbi:hypothetical protein [Bradyrhizobium sp. USDA 4454]